MAACQTRPERETENSEQERLRLEDLLAQRLGLDYERRQSLVASASTRGAPFIAKSRRVAYELDNALQGPSRQGSSLVRNPLDKDWEQKPGPSLSQPVSLLSADQGPVIWCFETWPALWLSL